MQIKDSVFLVTGGASDDYGRATVEKLLREGARVVICDLPTRDLHIFGDDKAIFIPIDASQEKDTATLVSVIEEKYGRLDGVVNCIDNYKSTPIYDAKNSLCLKDYADVVYENVLVPFNIIRYTVPLLAKNIPKKGSGRGVIINMSSIAAFKSQAGACAYAASKAAVIRMTEALGGDLAGIQVRCLTIVTTRGGANGAVNGLNGIRSCFDNVAKADDCDEPKKFAELVKNVIESSNVKSPLIRMDSNVQ